LLQEPDPATAPAIKFNMPLALKRQLVEDWELVTQKCVCRGAPPLPGFVSLARASSYLGCCSPCRKHLVRLPKPDGSHTVASTLDAYLLYICVRQAAAAAAASATAAAAGSDAAGAAAPAAAPVGKKSRKAKAAPSALEASVSYESPAAVAAGMALHGGAVPPAYQACKDVIEGACVHSASCCLIPPQYLLRSRAARCRPPAVL